MPFSLSMVDDRQLLTECYEIVNVHNVFKNQWSNNYLVSPDQSISNVNINHYYFFLSGTDPDFSQKMVLTVKSRSHDTSGTDNIQKKLLKQLTYFFQPAVINNISAILIQKQSQL